MRRQRNLLGPQGMGGMVGLWGTNSLIRSIQSGSANMQGATTSNFTIAAVDMTNCIVLSRGLTYGTDSDDIGYMVAYWSLTNSTTATVTRNSGGSGSGTWSATVIEFAPGIIKSRQSGVISMGGGQASLTATITSVDTAKSMVVFTGFIASAGTAAMASIWPSLTLTNATTVTLARNTSSSGTGASYQVVEFF